MGICSHTNIMANSINKLPKTGKHKKLKSNFSASFPPTAILLNILVLMPVPKNT